MASNGLATAWYYQAMGSEIGPVSAAELKEKASAGVIQPDTLIRQGAGGRWVMANQASGLFTPAANAVVLATPVAPKPTAAAATPKPISVVITDIDIPIMRLATLQFRLAIAAFPALLMLFVAVVIPALIATLFITR